MGGCMVIQLLIRLSSVVDKRPINGPQYRYTGIWGVLTLNLVFKEKDTKIKMPMTPLSAVCVQSTKGYSNVCVSP